MPDAFSKLGPSLLFPISLWKCIVPVSQMVLDIVKLFVPLPGEELNGSWIWEPCIIYSIPGVTLVLCNRGVKSFSRFFFVFPSLISVYIFIPAWKIALPYVEWYVKLSGSMATHCLRSWHAINITQRQQRDTLDTSPALCGSFHNWWNISESVEFKYTLLLACLIIHASTEAKEGFSPLWDASCSWKVVFSDGGEITQGLWASAPRTHARCGHP